MVDKSARQAQPGDIIAFAYPPDPSITYLKRVVAVGGDLVETVDGRLIINGKEVWRERVQNGCAEETAQEGIPYILWEESLGERRYQIGFEEGLKSSTEPHLVAPGTVFVLSDNRDNSSDSRVWGDVPLENVKGTVRFIFGSAQWDRINQPVR